MKKILTVLAILVLINIFVWFIYLPHNENKLGNELVLYKNLRQELASSKLLTFEDIYRMRDKLGDIEKRLRSQKDFSKLITYIFEQSMSANVDIKDVNYNFEEKKELKISKLTLQLNTEGSYNNLRRFIYKLESGTHLFQVENVKITRGLQNVTAYITLTSYLKADPQ